MKDKLLVLDLDETLVYGTEECLDREPDFRVDRHNLYIRPYVSGFLDVCFAYFRVGVWTSSTYEYAQEVVSHVFNRRNLDFVWDRSRCTLRYDHEAHEYYWVKDLAKLKRRGYPLEHIAVIDDCIKTAERNHGNLIRVSEWHGNVGDRELFWLSRYLPGLVNAANIRFINKKKWKRKAMSD